MTSSVFEHAWLNGLFGDKEVAHHLSPETTLPHMLAIEAAYARALGRVGVVAPNTAQEASAAILTAKIIPADLRDGTGQDGVVVPALITKLKEQLPEYLHCAIHKGLTSQDVIDTSLILSLKPILTLFETRLTNVIGSLNALESTFGSRTIMGRTRMQAARPIKVASRIEAWRAPLQRHLIRLVEIQPRLLQLQLGGAVGDRATLAPGGQDIAKVLAAELDVTAPDTSWHATRDNIAEFAGWLSLLTGSLGKMGADLTLMSQQGIDEVAFASGGASSAMPHKQNPVAAELLVTLATFNATQVSGMHATLVHEQERSGAAWSLEWMLLPQMVMATGRALTIAQSLPKTIERIGSC
jgi:3-carboxy-cis,cis-muconate cycloisomerase